MDKFEFIKNVWRWEPHKTQREFMAYETKIKVGACGRRWGKSEALAYDMAYSFLTKRNYTQMIVSPTYDQSKLIFRTIESLLFNKGVTIKRSPYSTIRLNKNLITARTADNDGAGLRGNKADRIIIDEAAYIKDSVVYEVISPMLADTNGDLVLISTPFGKNYFYDFYKRGVERSGEIASFTYKSTDNPYINKEYIEKQRLNISSISFETEYEAKFCDNVSNVFRDEVITGALLRDLSLTGQYVMGVDFARYGDWTVAIVLKTDGEFFQMVDMVRFNKVTWEEEIKRIIALCEKYTPQCVVCDATGVGDPLCEQIEKILIDSNMPCEIIPFKFTNERKNLIIDYLNVLLESGSISILNDAVLKDELRNFEYSFGESGMVKLEAKYNHHDDTVCALALACHGGKGLSGRFLVQSW